MGALLLAALLLLGLDAYVRHKIQRNLLRLAELNLPENTRGIAVQARVLALPHCLPVYGSSELDILQPTRADLFFHDRQHGFRAVTIGQTGDRCILVLQDLAALGDALRGRKIAIFLSPTWFQSTSKPSPESHYENSRMAANFSALQAGKTLTDDYLSFATRRAVASRLLDYREIMRERSPLVGAALTSLGATHPAWLGRISFCLLRPLLSLQNTVLAFQDRYQQLGLLHSHSAKELEHPFDLRHKFAGWNSLLEEVGRSQRKKDQQISPDGAKIFKPGHIKKARPDTLADPDADFRRRTEASTEWDDLDLLLDTLRQLKARPLLISQPFNGIGSDGAGVSAESRRQCYERIAQIAAAHHVPLLDFSAHEYDAEFFRDMVHPSAQAWVVYDEALAKWYGGKVADHNKQR